MWTTKTAPKLFIISVLDHKANIFSKDCKIAIPELKQKLEAVKQEKLYLEVKIRKSELCWVGIPQIDFQAQKGFLHAQLESAASVSAQLQGELREKDVELTGLRARVTRLEVSTKIFRTCKIYLGGLMHFTNSRLQTTLFSASLLTICVNLKDDVVFFI